ncbi:MAG: exo-beta-N-acetylmuramidase NamZ domain-containing protein [Phycisphaerae bacterium]
MPIFVCAGPNDTVRLGIDVVIADDFATLRGKRVGLITNPTGVTSDLRATADVLHAAPQVELIALFGPEHGVRGDVPAGEHIQDGKDAATGLPTYSLYGKTRKPTREMLHGLDALVFDIQDIGARSYTYVSTMAVSMQAAAEHDVEFIVLDRPNPLGGNRMEGATWEPEFQSFVSYLPVPYVHGMTVGELAKLINDDARLMPQGKCKLTVVPMQGWQRNMLWRDTGLQWVPTSPHVPHADSAMFYAATGIMGELHVLSEGVGVPVPFELAGFPGADAAAMAAALNRRELPGVIFRPTYFKPFYGSFEKKDCGGVQVHLVDPHAAHLTGIQFHVLDVVRTLQPDLALFGNKRDNMFDKVCGTQRIREAFEAGKSATDVLAIWDEGIDAFREKRKSYLLYE